MQGTNLGVLSVQLEISGWVCRGKITDSISQVAYSFYSYNKMYDKYTCRACLRRCGLQIKKMLSFWQLRVRVFDRFNLENHKSSVKYVSRCIQEIPYGI